ncbi:hypothetical protein TrST_g13328 [Triparma strigata]|uniref:Uncharacterized protein n=1 Tax=Triparma strigata TaxID=1606541 RepID=A0A9W6ZUT5_9STRA|nr:hypothetical protein TrST_g13328 [Triparma strigata]
MNTSRFFQAPAPSKATVETEQDNVIPSNVEEATSSTTAAVKREVEEGSLVESLVEVEAPPTPPVKKQKLVTGTKLVTEHSFDAIVGHGAHTLILGTFPSEESQATAEERTAKKSKAKKSKGKSKKSAQTVQLEVEKECFLRGSTEGMNYGNWKNPFWNIAATAYNYKRELTTYDEKKRNLIDNGYALWDVCGRVEKKTGSSLDTDIKSSVPNKIPELLTEYKDIKKIVFPATSSNFFVKHFKETILSEWLIASFWICTDDVGKMAMNNIKHSQLPNVRTGSRSDLEALRDSGEQVIELVIVQSTSPANCRHGVTPPVKEKDWLVKCYGWEATRPKEEYVCAVCEAKGEHYVVDCEGYTLEWRELRKAVNKRLLKDPKNIKKNWDFRGWTI